MSRQAQQLQQQSSPPKPPPPTQSPQQLLLQQQQQERCARDVPGLESAADALLDAVTRGKSHLVKFLLEACEKEVEVATNFRDFKGKTPLIRAVYITEEKCRQRIMEMLLAHCAEPNLQDDAGRTALSYACELRRNDVVRMLVKHNVDPELPDKDGNTPLMHCSRVGNDSGIAVLLKCFRRLGLDPDRCNREGCTALLIAARGGFVECASLLAGEGRASVTRTDPEFGRNAEQWARAQGCTTPEVAPFSADRQVAPRRVHGGAGSNRGMPPRDASASCSEAEENDDDVSCGSSDSRTASAVHSAGLGGVRASRSSTLTTRVSSIRVGDHEEDLDSDDYEDFVEDAGREGGDSSK